MVDERENRLRQIQLRSDTITIQGQLATQPEWFEFDVTCNGQSLGPVGEQALSVFIRDMLDVLDKASGKRLRQIPGAAFKELVGGDDSEYLGHVMFAGYNTLYFFKEGTTWIHVVLADSGADLMGHARLAPEVFRSWGRYLRPPSVDAKANSA